MIYTGGKLHPGTNLIYAAGVTEEEKTKAADGSHHQQESNPHEEHGCFKSSRRNGSEIQSASFTHQLSCNGVPDAVVEKTEVSGLRGVHTVPDPVRLNEHHHSDDGKADGEDDPEHTDGSGVSHIVGVVDLGRFLSWD